jgi:hypothetical protein
MMTKIQTSWPQHQARTLVPGLDFSEIIILKKIRDQIQKTFQLGCELQSNVKGRIRKEEDTENKR